MQLSELSDAYAAIYMRHLLLVPDVVEHVLAVVGVLGKLCQASREDDYDTTRAHTTTGARPPAASWLLLL